MHVIALPQRTHHRRAAAVVELAIVLPIFVLLVIGTIDLGRAISVQHKLVQAARAGCRLHAVKNEVPAEQVTAVVDAVMARAGLTNYTLQLDPADSNSIQQLEPVTVTVSIAYDDVSWLPTSRFLAGRTLSGTCVMPGDTGELTSSGGSGGGGTPPEDDSDDDSDDDDDDGGGSRGRGRGGGRGGGWGWGWSW